MAYPAGSGPMKERNRQVRPPSVVRAQNGRPGGRIRFEMLVCPIIAQGIEETAIMSTVPAKQTSATQPPESPEDRFQRLAALWLAETAYLSSSSDLVAHPAFQEIVAV